MAWNRRGVLFAGAGLLTVPGGAQQTTVVRTRPSASSRAGQRQLTLLARAVPILRASGAWHRQIELHADMDTHQHHSSWRFMPWHRAQLMWFEAIVSAAAGEEFSLPYWDWTNGAALPPQVFDMPALRLPGRRARRGQRVPAEFMRSRFEGTLRDDVDQFLGEPVLNRGRGRRHGFSGTGEHFGHNAIHGFVGGSMSFPETAPEDPIFWLHHCNVDRVWASWEALRFGLYPEAWLEEDIRAFDTGGPELSAPLRAGDLVDTARVSRPYRYERLLDDGVGFFRLAMTIVDTASRTLRPVAAPGVEAIFDFRQALQELDTWGGGDTNLQYEAVLYATAMTTPRSQRTFAATNDRSGKVQAAVFPSHHHRDQPVKIVVTPLLGYPLGEASRIRLAGEDRFARGEDTVTFSDTSLVLTAKRLRPS